MFVSLVIVCFHLSSRLSVFLLLPFDPIYFSVCLLLFHFLRLDPLFIVSWLSSFWYLLYLIYSTRTHVLLFYRLLYTSLSSWLDHIPIPSSLPNLRYTIWDLLALSHNSQALRFTPFYYFFSFHSFGRRELLSVFLICARRLIKQEDMAAVNLVFCSHMSLMSFYFMELYVTNLILSYLISALTPLCYQL